MAKTDEILLSNAQACRVWKISRNGLAEWVKNGFPLQGRSKYPLFSGADWVEAFRSTDKASLTEERTRLTKAQAEKAELELKIKRGQFRDEGEISDDLSILITNCKIALLSLPKRLCPVLEGMTGIEMYGVIEADVKEILKDLAAGGKSIGKGRR